MKIILKKLILRNFKKLSGEFEFNEKRTVYAGRNGAGKTTLYDAECWLRTGKDSQGKANFSIKTVEGGEEMSKTEHAVKAVYEVDGRERSFERIFKEKWTRKRGRIEAEFGGHVTEFRLNDKAKTPKREFEKEIKEIFGDWKFTLVSDRTYFAGLSGEQRRELLIELAGEIDKDEIVDGVEGLRGSIGDMSLEEKAAWAKQRRTQINDDLKELPARIDENRRQLKEATDGQKISLEGAEQAVTNANQAHDLAEANIKSFKDSQAIDATDKLSELSGELRRAIAEFEQKKTEASLQLAIVIQKKDKINFNLKHYKNDIEYCENQLDVSREKYRSVHALEFQKQSNECRFCGEVIVCPHCDENEEEGLKQFNNERAKSLSDVNEKGKKLFAHKKGLEEKLVAAKKELAELEKVQPDPILEQVDNELIRELKEQILKIEQELPEKTPVPEELFQELQKASDRRDKARETLSAIKASRSIQERMEELEARMTKLSGEFNELEKFFYLLDQYNRKLAEVTEMSVNKYFEYVSFKMFRQQVNGAVLPVCEIMNKEECLYETAMSTGERIRAGLDIIKTFSRHYNLYAPVFIDHSESLTTRPELDCQVIELCVAEKYEELTKL